MTAKFNMPLIIQQFIVFCGVGALNTALSLLIILVLSEFMGVHYVLANIIGYAAGLASGFFMHKNLTFKSQTSDKTVRVLAFLFLLIFAIGYAAQLILLVLMVEIMHMSNLPAQILAWCLYVGISFTGNKFFTFDGDKHE